MRSILRPSEPQRRRRRVEDVDVTLWRILVSHPKGEDSWAAPDYAPILGPAREPLREFLVEREAYLAGETSEWLVPYRCPGGAIVSWDDSLLLELKADLAEASGVRFSLKTFRATFGQMSVDRGVAIEKVSRAMRHKSTKTTEAFYARIRSENAFVDLERAFERPVVRLDGSR